MTLTTWRNATLPQLRLEHPTGVPNPSTTIIAYFFHAAETANCAFEELEFAIRQTWKCCGGLPVNIITNKPCFAMTTFAEQISPLVKITISPRLIPGNLMSMSRDMDGCLIDYFDTENVLIIQNDGMPLCERFKEFEGRFDYIGAPFPPGRDDWITRRLLRPDTLVGNGGFSLRSRRLCEYACHAYRKIYRFIPDCYLLNDDIYYCRLLSTYEKKYRTTMHFATPEEAARFSFEDDTALFNQLSENPFGFHSQRAFHYIASHYTPQTP